MKQKILLKTMLLLCTLVAGSTSVWADPTVLFHETFGNNTGSARAWDDSYSVKSGVSAVYSGITGYTVSNAKQGKNTTGSTQSGLNQSTQGTDAYIVIGPLNVADYESLAVTYQWKAASIKGTYTTKLEYATSSGGSYTVVSGTGTGATSFVECSYSLPAAAQVSTLYLKITWNTSNTQGIIDEVELTGTSAGGGGGSTPSIDLSSNSVDATTAETDGTITVTYNNIASIDAEVKFYEADGSTPADYSSWFAADIDGENNVYYVIDENTGSARTAYMKVHEKNEDIESALITITQAAYVAPKTYTLVSALTSGKTYVIASSAADGDVKIMGAQGSSNRGVVNGSVDGTVLSTTENPTEVVVNGPDASGYYTLYDAENGYLYASSNTKNYLNSQVSNDENGIWSISIDDGTKAAVVEAQGSNTHNLLRYNPNNGSPLFSCYSSTSSIENPVYFYEKDGEATPTESVEVSSLGYATYATSDNALDFSGSGINAYIAKANGRTGVTFEQVNKVPARTGVLLYAAGGASASIPALTGNITTSDYTGNVFVPGANDAVDSVDGVLHNYVLNKPSDSDPIGFYQAAGLTVPVGKAYIQIDYDTVTAVKEFIALPGMEDDATGIEGVQDVQEVQGAIYNLAGQRLNKMQKGINIVNGKKILY